MATRIPCALNYSYSTVIKVAVEYIVDKAQCISATFLVTILCGIVYCYKDLKIEAILKSKTTLKFQIQ